MTDRIAIVAAKRTPLGAFNGHFVTASAPTLAATAIKAAYQDAKLNPELITDAYVGCVLSAGMRQAPGRQAVRQAGLSDQTATTTVNKVCGSGMQSIIFGMQAILTQQTDCVLAAGMENMSQTPYLSPRSRFGNRLGHGQLLDHLFYDGLENAYDNYALMGVFADHCANEYHFSRADLDAFSAESTRRAKAAIANKQFTPEIAPVTVSHRRNTHVIDVDEPPGLVDVDKLERLRPAFSPDGVTTAGNSSSIADGAAAVILMPEEAARANGITPLAYITATAHHAQSPEWFTTAPVTAIEKVLNKTGWRSNEVDFYEVNEAFAAVTMAAMQSLDLPHEKVNIHGGAVALGHPLGATGTRIVVTLVHALLHHQKQRGIAALCIGGGEALALAITRE